MNDAQLVDMLSGTTPDARRRLLNRSGWRKKRRGRQATAQEFVRANFPVLKQGREAGASWWDMPELIKEHFGGRRLSRAALNKVYRQVEKDMKGWEEADNAKTIDW